MVTRMQLGVLVQFIIGPSGSMRSLIDQLEFRFLETKWRQMSRESLSLLPNVIPFEMN